MDTVGAHQAAGEDQAAMFTASEVSARTGVLAVTLRQWERRYGFPAPARNASGYRLYSPRDIAQIEMMQSFLRDGVAAGRAAALTVQRFAAHPAGAALLTSVEERQAATQTWAASLLQTLVATDLGGAARCLGEAQKVLRVEDLLLGVVSPVLVEIGALWERGDITVAHEHHATAFLRARLQALLDAEGEDHDGPLVVAACAPGEHHEMGLLMLSLMLRRQGARVTYLGANTPLGDLAVFARQTRADAVMLALNGDWALEGTLGQLRDLDGLQLPLFIGGALVNVRPGLACELGGQYAGPDAVEASRIILEGLGYPASQEHSQETL